MESIATVLTAKDRDIGGSSVRRLLPQIGRKAIGPFVFFDHMGPATFAPGTGIDVRPHPHIRLATVTYLFDGAITHRDSLGCEQVITPGDVNWMTAGSGIVHSERTPPERRQSGGGLDGLQCWVALPKEREEMAPSFRHHPGRTLPEVVVDGVRVKVLVGRMFGVESPVETEGDVVYAAVTLEAGQSLRVAGAGRELGVYDVEARTLSVILAGSDHVLSASRPTRAMILGGAPLPEPRHMWWNFVSSSKERIEQAKADWAARRFGTIPGDDREFIPLPDERPPGQTIR